MTRVRWWISAAVIAAAAVWAAVVTWREPRDPLVRLARAAGKFDTRLTEARLSGFAYRPFSSHPQPRDAAHLRFRALAGKVLQSTAHDDHAAGVAALLLGANDDAVKRLTACTKTHPTDASAWNDLAAAQYSEASSNDDPQQLVTALADVDQALRIATLPEAKFNRGLILESLGLAAAAAKQYESYLTMDASSDWAKEVRNRIDRLHATPTSAEQWQTSLPQLERAAREGNENSVAEIVRNFTQEAESWSETVFLAEWGAATLRSDTATSSDRLRIAEVVAHAVAEFSGDTFLRDSVAAINRDNDPNRLATLASAYVEYDAARKMYRSRRVSDASALLAASTLKFAKAGSPMQFVARYYTSSCLHNLMNDEGALDYINALRNEVPASYSDLRGRLLWNLGLIYARQGKQYAALSAETDAATIFQKCGEQPNVITMLGQAAASEAILGRQAEAWQTRRTLFRAISRRGDLGELQVALDIAARTEIVMQSWATAYSLLTIASDNELRVNPQIAVNTLLWRALTAQRLGFNESSLAKHIRDARDAASTIPDQTLHRRSDADVTFAQAVTIRASQPARASALLDRYIAFVKEEGGAFLLPEALLERALAARSLGDQSGARTTLVEAALILRNRQSARRLDEFREAFFSTSGAVARELCSALLRDGNVNGALVALDDSRSEAYGASSFDWRSIPRGTILLEYAVLDDRLAVFIGRHDGIRVRWQSNAVVDRVCPASTAGPNCGNLLLTPAKEFLETVTDIVVVPDPSFGNVPFATLRLPTSNRFLIEQATVTVAPGAAVAFQRRPVSTDGKRTGHVVIVGAPHPDQVRFSGLPPLPSSEREARTLAFRHSDATVLIGRAATPLHVLSALASASTLYLSAHAFTSSDPKRSHIVLTSDGDNAGVLFLKDIERKRSDSLRLVVLAGCRTAAGAQRSAVSSLALGFVAVGAEQVVGTISNVEDSIAADFSSWLDEELRTSTPAQGVRAVQLRMLTSANPRLREPEIWGAFEIYGRAEKHNNMSVTIKRKVTTP